mgnify:CR=1 FL=1
MSNNQTLKDRDSSLDMAKGILIAMLIFHHIVDVGIRLNNINNNVLSIMEMIQSPLIVCYFMPSFFIITGMCSTFKKQFIPFFIRQIKTLLLPAIVFVFLFHLYQGDSLKTLLGDVKRLFWLGSDYWFITALFEAKIFYYFLRKYLTSNKVLFLILLCLSSFGALLNDLFNVKCPNDFFMIRHTLDLMVFIGVGNLFKDYFNNRNVIIVTTSLFVLLVSLYIITGEHLPYVTYTFATSLISWPIHIVLSISGTVAIITVCRYISNNHLIEYIGKNSLSIYLMQWYTLIMFIDAFENILSENDIVISIACISSIFISTISIGLFVAYITNNTKLRILMGKF